MPTRRLTVDPQTVQTEDLAAAVAWLREGSVVAFPTDTLYGLAVDPFSDAAVRVLFDLKGRPARAAIPLLADSIEQVEAVCGPMGSTGARLAAAWWPGPLSLILDAPARVSVASEYETAATSLRSVPTSSTHAPGSARAVPSFES